MELMLCWDSMLDRGLLSVSRGHSWSRWSRGTIDRRALDGMEDLGDVARAVVTLRGALRLSDGSVRDPAEPPTACRFRPGRPSRIRWSPGRRKIFVLRMMSRREYHQQARNAAATQAQILRATGASRSVTTGPIPNLPAPSRQSLESTSRTGPR